MTVAKSVRLALLLAAATSLSQAVIAAPPGTRPTIDIPAGPGFSMTSVPAYLFDTTLNIDGLSSGYAGPGVKTILPNRAFAKLDSRLVPDQTPEEALALLKAHLAAKGFGDIEVRLLGGYPASQTSVDTPLIKAVLGTYNKYGLAVDVSPRSGGSRPSYVFTQTLGLPDVTLSIGHGADAHAPNEYLLIDPKPGSKVFGLSAMEKFYVDTLYAIAATK